MDAAVPDPITSAGATASIASGKLLTMAAGFLGALITLGLREEQIPPRKMVALILFGCLSSYFVPPIVVAWLQHSGSATWLPFGGSVEGLLGLLIGMGCIYITRAFNVIGARFAKDPVAFVANQGKTPGDQP